jgi:hypothetical protein
MSKILVAFLPPQCSAIYLAASTQQFLSPVPFLSASLPLDLSSLLLVSATPSIATSARSLPEPSLILSLSLCLRPSF